MLQNYFIDTILNFLRDTFIFKKIISPEHENIMTKQKRLPALCQITAISL